MVGVVETVGIHKMRSGHAQFRRFFVHHRDELLHRAADVLGHGIGGVVGGKDDHHFQTAFQRVGGSRFIFQIRSLLGHRRFGKRHFIAERDFTLLHRVQRHKKGHQLGDAGGIAQTVGIDFIEDHTAVGVHEHRGGGVQPRRCFRQRVVGVHGGFHRIVGFFTVLGNGPCRSRLPVLGRVVLSVHTEGADQNQHQTYEKNM